MKRLKAESGKRRAEQRRAERRRATTLAEVLVSIMILSIGLISLAVLFPISILRSVQATQLTNAAIISVNAETQIDISPEMVFNPDGDDPTVLANLLEHFRKSSKRNYIIDPVGWNKILDHTNGADLQLIFGHDGVVGNEMPMGNLPRWPGLPARFDAATIFDNGMNLNPPTTVAQARAFALSNALTTVTLPDSWVDQEVTGPGSWVPTTTITIGTPPTDIDITGFTFAEADLSAVSYTSTVPSRIVLFDTTGKKSQIRKIFNINGRTVTWKGADNPNNFDIGLARIETQETRYTWLLTVRQLPSGYKAQVDVVVLFRRPDSPTGEKLYQAVFTGPTTQRINGEDVKIPGSRDARITFPADDEPALKKGGYILDTINAHWYRIQDIDKTATTATLRLDRPAIATSNTAMVLEGVIEVFPLEPKDNVPFLNLLENF
jgi:hypothetical protein